jgi:hypothetical protein
VLAAAGMLLPVSSALALGFSLSGEAFTVGEPAPYRAATIRLEPEVVIGTGRTVLHVRGYGGVGASDVRVVRDFFRRSPEGPIRVSTGIDVASSLWALGGALVLRHAGPVLVPTVTLEAYDSPQGGYMGARAGFAFLFGRGTLRLEGGAWDTPDGAEGVVSAGLEIFVGESGSVFAGGGRYGPDPLLDTPVAVSASAGITTRLTSLGPVPESSYELRGAGETRVVRVLLRAPEAQAVSFTGDLTEWTVVSMIASPAGWTVELQAVPGAHHYGFIVDGDWYVPADAPGRSEDEWGGVHATLIIPPAQNGEEM